MKKPPQKVAYLSRNSVVSEIFHLLPTYCPTSQMAEFMFSNMAYRATVYRTGPTLCSCDGAWTFYWPLHIPTHSCPRSYWMSPNPLSLPPQHKQITSLREKCSTNPQEILNPVCTGHWMNSNVCSIMCVSSSKSFIKPWRLEETKLSRDSGHTVIIELFNLKEYLSTF